MSAEATVAVFEHAEGSDAEWRMLALLANAANSDGVVYDITIEALAEVMGKTVRGTEQVKRRLVDSGQLEVVSGGGGRGRVAIYWLKFPGLKGPEETPKDPVEKLKKGTGKKRGRSIQGKTEGSSTTAAAREAELLEELRDAEIDDEILAEAKALIAAKKKVGGKIVTPREMACAAAALATFNRIFEWRGSSGSSYGLGAAAPSIVERCRERPTWDPSKHVRLVESAWRIRWWEKTGSRKRPGPNVIYGPGAFEQVAQDAKEEKAGVDVKPEGRRYTRANR